MEEWIRSHQTLLWVLGVLSVVTFLGTLIAIPILVARMPADYFRHPKPPAGSWRDAHPALRLALVVTKNIAGGLFLLAGLAMLLLPGQGILTILIGMSLIGFPGKRRLELRLVQIRAVTRSVNWIRKRAGRPPLRLPDESVPDDQAAPLTRDEADEQATGDGPGPRSDSTAHRPEESRESRP